MRILAEQSSKRKGTMARQPPPGPSFRCSVCMDDHCNRVGWPGSHEACNQLVNELKLHGWNNSHGREATEKNVALLGVHPGKCCPFHLGFQPWQQCWENVLVRLDGPNLQVGVDKLMDHVPRLLVPWSEVQRDSLEIAV